MWYFSMISSAVSELPEKLSAPKKKRLVNSWPTCSSRVIDSRVSSTQEIWSGSSWYGAAVRSTSAGMVGGSFFT